MRRFRAVWAVPDIRTILILGLVVRIPTFSVGLILTLHIVDDLGRSYGDAGLVGGAFTLAAAVAQPWRGRLVDRQGLRRTVLPSLILLPLLWGAAPFVSFWVLLALAVAAGLIQVPSFSILRQVIIRAAPVPLRRTALSLDSVLVEFAFGLGPILAVLAVQAWGATWALLVFSLASVAATGVLYAVNPATVDAEPSDDGSPATGRWVSPAAIGALGMMGAAVFVIAGTDLAAIAGLRELGSPGAIGWVFALWALGSALGGLLYGGQSRAVPPSLLLVGLAVVTAPAALAVTPLGLGGLLFVAGLFCAPTIAATVDALSYLVPAHRRGEAMGWHGAVGTAGNALGAPVIGFAIDHLGWPAGFWSSALVGLVCAAGGGAVVQARRRRMRRRDVVNTRGPS